MRLAERPNIIVTEEARKLLKGRVERLAEAFVDGVLEECERLKIDIAKAEIILLEYPDDGDEGPQIALSLEVRASIEEAFKVLEGLSYWESDFSERLSKKDRALFNEIFRLHVLPATE
jgi:hypothetical protein